MGTVYRSPNSDRDNDAKVNELFSVTQGRSHVLVCGDFNHPEIDWLDVCTPKDCNHPAAKFVEAVRDSFLVQHVQKPTHVRGDQTPNVLDLIFTSEEAMVGEIRHEAPLGKSHHHSLLFQFHCYTRTVHRGPARYIYAKGDYAKLRQLVEAEDVMGKILDMDVCQAWDTLCEAVHVSMDSAIPKTKPGSKKKKPLWLNEKALCKVRKKRQAYQRYLQTRDGKDYDLYARARNQAKKACRDAVKETEKSVAMKAKQNPKAFYAYARTKLNTRDGIADLTDGGTKVSSDSEKANVLNNFFSSVFTDEDTSQIPDCAQQDFQSVLQDVDISSDAVLKKLKELNPNKSAGPDKLHPRVLSELSSVIAEPLALIFSKSLSEGKLPPVWKEAQVTPLFKKGDKSKPGNYRPVSLTSIVCKILESLIRDKMMEHLEANNLLSDCQHGFVPGRSCSTNLLACLEDWTKALDDGKDVDAVYLDMAKAFDSVPHERLLCKLEALGIQGRVWRWVKDFLVGRRQRVCVNGSLSDWASVRSGVPQGSVLGPVLFVAFINDLPDAVSSASTCKMYADDTKVFSVIDTPDDSHALQKDLDSLVDWADQWQLKYNADKCHVLQMGNQKDKHSYEMRKHGSESRTALQESVLEKDLGVNVDNELKFSRHIEIQVNKANKILGLIRRSFEFLDAKSMRLLFIALVRPHLEFCNVVWSPRLEKDKKLIEGVLRRATKVIPGFKDVSYEQRLEKLKIPSMTYRRVRGDLIETYKYTHGYYRNENVFTLDTEKNTRGHQFKLKKPRCRTSQRQHFFSQRVIDRWNNLPAEIAEAPTMNSFKNRLDTAMRSYMYSIEEPPTKIWSKDH
jgi:hypothetical protein